ncbi:hypothetical protein D3C76_180220 [compost metagenome]
MAVMIDKEQQVELKLGYLRELTSIIESGKLAIWGTKDVWERIQRVSDSIEKDLGICKPFNVGDITIKIDVDTTDFQKMAKRLSEIITEARERSESPLPNL